MNTSRPKVKISVRDLFKVFGEDPLSILPLLYDGIDKTELQKNTAHILALNNINVDNLNFSLQPRPIKHLSSLSKIGKIFFQAGGKI